jgi:hypothetical protein
MRSPRHTARTLLPALATILVLGVGQASQAACYGPGQQLPTQVVSQFINDPRKLLTQFPSGGPQMISLIRDLVASDPGALTLIINLNAKANAEQIQAIGAGLGQAALVCRQTAPAFANEIQQMTITADNRPLTQAFSAVMGDLFLGSADPAGGGGGGPTATNEAIGGVPTSGGLLNLTTSVPTAFGVGGGRGGATNGTAGALGASSGPSSLTTNLNTASSKSTTTGLFTSPTPGNSGGKAGGTPGGPSSSVSPNSIVIPNTIARSVSRSTP